MGPGNFGETVSLLGFGQIGRRVRELLLPFNLQVLVYDPFLSEANASSAGVKKVTLEEAFDIKIPDQTAETLLTVQHIIDYVSQKIESAV